jgi:4'-phosphopantetheinyl transferase
MAATDLFCDTRILPPLVDDVEIHLLDLGGGAEREEAALPWLSSAELARFRKLVCIRARREFAICRAMLRALLVARLRCPPGDLDVVLDPFGKPRATRSGQPADIHFNLSHTTGMGLIALSDRTEIGVDVEAIHRDVDIRAIANIVFTEAEMAWLGSPEEAGTRLRFFRMWTLKEAALKAIGAGFLLDPKRITLPEAAVVAGETVEVESALPIGVTGPGRLRLVSLAPAPGVVASLAIRL